jgi:hypothetical protein
LGNDDEGGKEDDRVVLSGVGFVGVVISNGFLSLVGEIALPVLDFLSWWLSSPKSGR